ncbi:condensation domain-containing protein [Xenorhabdus szentirmaii]|uniref:Condensation domain-containing protein n=1 Tax=Xenorhabdus szentirmaii DSM 16338 TaxID=1427518 RepID=W1J6Q8_9GAMM|nr:condensation domain-containing protein [Xenorhabdus szentirmaii]PHM32984.1 Amino acid adenylation [Xenorhabdus szentirmaii DSM 16338]PHM40696.1 Amino acid adenylation [Xenorhabdus szentirmaii]CDL85170.1 hypothetical protein XSR1_630006 [Xenorhabdus szentirmaii DSM 16338]
MSIKSPLRQSTPLACDFGKKRREQWLPLGYSQHCFWFVASALGDTVNNHSGILIEGELRVDLLEQAINDLIQSNISLRTEILDYAPVQRPCRIDSFDLPLLDLSAHDAAEQDQHIFNNIRQLLNTPFDLKSPPHLRAQLYLLGKTKYMLSLFFPHIVADGGAIHLFEQQLWRRYAQGCQGRKPLSTTANDMQIDEWVRHERENYRRQGKQNLAFWRNHLAGYPYARFPAPYINQDVLIDHEFFLPFPDGSYEQLDVLAKQQRATLQMVFMTLVAEVVYEMTGQSRFSLNSVLEGRDQPGSETLMIPLLRVMPVPVCMETVMKPAINKTANKPSQRETATLALLEHIKVKILQAYDHMDCPWSTPVGIVAEQRWKDSPKIYAWAIRAGSWIYSKIFRRSELYPRFLADLFFMEPHPPKSLFRRRKSHQAVSDPIININILQNVFKTPAADPGLGGLRLSAYWQNEHREEQTQPSQAISTRWENDSINIYMTLSEKGVPIMQISCCCFNQEGMAKFTGLLKTKLSSLSQLITK